jgi:MFS family permease
MSTGTSIPQRPDVPLRLDASAVPTPRLRVAGALAYPSFRWFALAQFISFTLLTVQMMVRGWQMQELTHSPFMVSLVGALQVLPMLLFGFFGGELADRFPRKRVVIWGEVFQLVAFAALAAPAAIGVVQPWHILASTALLGVIMALASPSRQALIVDTVSPPDHRKAIGAYMVVIHLTILTGPALGGPLLTGIGTSGALVISTAVFVACIPLYVLVDPVKTQKRSRPKGPLVRDLAAGVRYIAREPSLRWMFLALFVMVLFVNTWGGLFPTFAEEVLHRGASGLSGIALAVGVGAVAGAVLAMVLSGKVPDARLQFMGALMFSAFVIVLAVSTWYPLALAATVIAAASGAPFFISNMAATQLNSAEEYRGRVVSVRYVVSAVQPLGLIAMGAAAEVAGPQWALGGSAAMGGGLMLLLAFTVARKDLRAARATPAGPLAVAGPAAGSPARG